MMPVSSFTPGSSISASQSEIGISGSLSPGQAAAAAVLAARLALLLLVRQLVGAHPALLAEPKSSQRSAP